MEKLFLNLKNNYIRLKIILGAVCLFSYAVLIQFSGGSLGELFLFWCCLIVYVMLPGLLFTHTTRLTSTFKAGQIPLGVLFGTGFIVVLYCITMRLNIIWVLRVLPPILSLVWFVFFCPRLPKTLKAYTVLVNGVHAGFFMLFGVLCLLFAFYISVKNAHPGLVGQIPLTQDLMWNIGNVEAFTIAFPPQDIRFSMVRLTYHYLTELFEAALVLVSGIPAYNIVAFYAGPGVILAMLICLHNFALVYYKSENKALLFTFSILFFNCASTVLALPGAASIFGNTNFYHLISNINSQVTLLVFLPVFLMLLHHIATRHFKVPPMELVALLCCFVLVCFSKGPAAAIVVCAFFLAMLVALLQKPHFGGYLVAFAGVLGIFVFIYLNVFASGANTSMVLNFETFYLSPVYLFVQSYSWAAAHSILGIAAIFLAAVFCMQPFQLPLALFGLFKDTRHLLTLPLVKLLAYAASFGGMLAYFIFFHVNSSQVYFALVAIFFLNLLAVDQLTNLRSPLIKKAVTLLGAIGLCTTVVLSVCIAGSGLRQFGRNVGMLPAQGNAAGTTTAAEEEAMLWLHENAPKNAVFAVNTTAGISNVYTAISGRQAYLEGYSYAITNMGVAEHVVAEKQSANAALFAAETPLEKALQICSENNITYLVWLLKFGRPSENFTFCTLVFSNNEVEIYKLP